MGIFFKAKSKDSKVFYTEGVSFLFADEKIANIKDPSQAIKNILD